MTWRKFVRFLWPFGKPGVGPEAVQACRQANRSQLRAQSDLRDTARLRAESDAVASQLKAHNIANRYDEFLRRVVQGRE